MDGRCIVVVEVKHKVVITDTIIQLFESKSMKVPIRFVTSTSKTAYSVSPSGTVSCEFTQFVTSQLQQALVKEPSICKRFIETCCANVISYRNLHPSMKKKITSMLEAHSA